MPISSVSGQDPAIEPGRAPAESATSRRGVGSPWVWTLVACLLLGVSGAVRAVQDRRHRDQLSYKEECPIAMKDFPATLGVWRMVKDSDKKLDDQTMRITGGSDHLVRTYIDDLTGVSVVVLLLYGPAVPVLPHTPDVCFPSSGYARGDAPLDQTITYSLGTDAGGKSLSGSGQFRSASYQKSAGRMMLREAVYHSFRLDGQWSPAIGSGRKFPRRNPGIFKIQVQRQVAEGETLAKGDPIEHFLSNFVSELEAALKKGPARTVAAR